MAPSLTNLPVGSFSLESFSSERLSRLKLPTLEKRTEMGDFITVYRASKGLEKIDNDLFVWDDRITTQLNRTQQNIT